MRIVERRGGYVPDGFSDVARHGLAAVCTSAANCLTGPRATVERRSAFAIGSNGPD